MKTSIIVKTPHPEAYTSPRCEVIALEMQGIIAESPGNKKLQSRINDNDW